MRHGLLVLFVVLFTVDDSLASILEQYVLKDGREQCEEIKPYCPPTKPSSKTKKKKPPPPPKVKPKKRCKRQYRLRPQNRCQLGKRPHCRKHQRKTPTATDKKIMEQPQNQLNMKSKSQIITKSHNQINSNPQNQNNIKPQTEIMVQNPKVQNEPLYYTPMPLQQGSREGSLLLKKLTRDERGLLHQPMKTSKTDTQRIQQGRKGELNCEPERPGISKITKTSEVLKKNTTPIPKYETNEIYSGGSTCGGCAKKVDFNDASPSSSKCVSCLSEGGKAAGRAGEINCDNSKTLINKKITCPMSPHFGPGGLNAGLNKKNLNPDNVVLEVKVPTLSQVARMGWKFVTFTTDQCVNIITKIHEARERKRHRLHLH